MQQYVNTFQDSVGRPVQGGTVTVYSFPSGALATLYSDNGVKQMTNPITTDQNGLFKFYAADGRYSLTFASPFTQPVSAPDSVLLEDPATLTASTGAALIGTSNGMSVESRLQFCPTAAAQPANAFADLVAPKNGSTYIDNVVTLRNLSTDSNGKHGNAAIRCRDAVTGYERAAFGYSGSGDAPTAYYPNTAYVEIGNLSPDAQDTIFRIIATYLAGSASYPAGMVYFPLEINPTTGQITINPPAGKTPIFQSNLDMAAGGIANPKQLALGMHATMMRMREGEWDDRGRISTNMNNSNAQDDPTKSSWRVAMGWASGFDDFVIGRIPAGSSVIQDLFRLDATGAQQNMSKTVDGTNGLTATTLSTQRMYLKGTAGASLAVTLPAAAAALDGALRTITSTVARASTTWTSSGATVNGAPSALAANTPVTLQYNHATLEWLITQ